MPTACAEVKPVNETTIYVGLNDLFFYYYFRYEVGANMNTVRAVCYFKIPKIEVMCYRREHWKEAAEEANSSRNMISS